VTDFDVTDPEDEIEDPQDKGELVKVMVPIENLSSKQISMLDLAEKIKVPEFKITL
jgi:hypothetical protein